MSSESTPSATLEWEDARSLVIATVRGSARGSKSQSKPLLEAHGQFLAEPLLADRDYPALRRSLRDGFAVQSQDLPGTFKVRGEVRAGEREQPAIAFGEALEIMTGAPVPDGANAVVMIEHVTRLSDSQIRIERTAEPGQFVNEQGAEAKSGGTLIRAGTRLDASHIATLAMSGAASVTVVAPPRVAILATGDEIVEIGESPAPHQIRNSNSYMLASLVKTCGGRADILPIARDSPEALRPLLERGLQADMLLVSGGVSAGRYDLVKPTLRQLGVEFHFERIRIQPGGPLAFGSLNGKPVFGLPGNPGSSLVTFQLFAQPALQVLLGDPNPLLPLFRARFEAPFRHRPGLTRFLPARLNDDGEHISHIPWQGSSDVPALAQADVFLVAPHDRELWAAGDEIRVMRKL